MHFTHYQKAGDKVFAVNPFDQYVPRYNFNGSIAGQSRNCFYTEFETWLSTQPPITADPSIEDGVYKVDELEIVWQFKEKHFKTWHNAPSSAYEMDIDYATFYERFKNTSTETRQYATIKQPVKQEEKPVKTYTADQCREIVLRALNRAAHQTESPTMHHRIISIDIDDLFTIFD